MKTWKFFIFFTVLMLVYASLHVYAGFVLAGDTQIFESSRSIVIGLLLVFFLSYPLGRFLERYFLNRFSQFLVTVGAFWIAVIIYLAPGLAGLQILAFCIPNLSMAWGFATLCLVVTLLIILGHWNATHCKISKYQLSLKKSLATGPLRLVVVSDIHMGTIVNKKRMETLVREINSLTPDLVLFPGDLLDEDLDPVIEAGLGQYFKQIKTVYGMFACTGNHEYIGGVDQGVAYLREHGIRVLRDECALLANSFYVVGRDDAAAVRFGGSQSKTLKEILENLNPDLPILLLDHSPVRLKEAKECGIDVSFSGHTHHGQQWPWNYITSCIYELSRGYLLKGSTHVLVSSGYGTWGPPVRIGSRSEMLLVTIS